MNGLQGSDSICVCVSHETLGRGPIFEKRQPFNVTRGTTAEKGDKRGLVHFSDLITFRLGCPYLHGAEVIAAEKIF